MEVNGGASVTGGATLLQVANDGSSGNYYGYAANSQHWSYYDHEFPDRLDVVNTRKEKNRGSSSTNNNHKSGSGGGATFFDWFEGHWENWVLWS